MLFLFRQLRRLELRKRSGQYCVYAVGEIVLVVLGILIAIQINNWAEEKADAKLEQIFISRLIEDIRVDVEVIGEFKAVAAHRLDLTELLIDSVANPEVALARPGEFLLAIIRSMAYSSPPLRSTTFEELKATGKIELIIDDTLKNLVFEYYNSDATSRQYRTYREARLLPIRNMLADVLPLEQQNWVHEELGLTVRHYEIDSIQHIEVEASWIVEAVDRIKQNHTLTSRLPQARVIHHNLRNNHQDRLERARELLHALEAAHQNGGEND